MKFNSVDFLIFLPLVFGLYWLVFHRKTSYQNFLLLVASYIFYGWWDFRFLSLIVLSTVIDYIIGKNIPLQNSPAQKKILLSLSILFNLGVLGFFKYSNFFIDSWVALFNSIGYKFNSTWTLQVILPVGISFYTFQTMSYSIDIYKGKLTPTKNFIAFAAFVSFFPQLVAGPIERATNLLPQILTTRKFNYQQAVTGMRLILWGMFKKVVIADSIAPVVDHIFANYEGLDGGVLWLGAIYFAIQIYCDFSGYSDIAIGTSKLFGFNLMTNFNFPYFSRNIGEFWRRWHISLSTWFRDYLYIPLGGSRNGKYQSIRNIFIIFTVSGFWHGSNWTFIFWGLYHACLFLPSFVFQTNRTYLKTSIAEARQLPSLQELFQVLITFLLVTVGWVFFRSETLNGAFIYLKKMFLEIQIPTTSRLHLIYVFLVLILDYSMRANPRKVLAYNSRVIRYLMYIIISIGVQFYFGYNETEFIYFQF